MSRYVSSIVFEIVDGSFVYRGWDVRGDHIHQQITPQHLVFGESGISLQLKDGQPKLEIPPGQNAELLQSDHAFQDGARVEGKFLEVQIF